MNKENEKYDFDLVSQRTLSQDSQDSLSSVNSTVDLLYRNNRTNIPANSDIERKSCCTCKDILKVSSGIFSAAAVLSVYIYFLIVLIWERQDVGDRIIPLPSHPQYHQEICGFSYYCDNICSNGWRLSCEDYNCTTENPTEEKCFLFLEDTGGCGVLKDCTDCSLFVLKFQESSCKFLYDEDERYVSEKREKKVILLTPIGILLFIVFWD